LAQNPGDGIFGGSGLHPQLLRQKPDSLKTRGKPK